MQPQRLDLERKRGSLKQHRQSVKSYDKDRRDMADFLHEGVLVLRRNIVFGGGPSLLIYIRYILILAAI